MIREVVIVDAVRTPIGKFRGSLSSVRPDDLAAHVIRALMERNPSIHSYDIDDVFIGCANQAGEDNRNIARMAVLLAGLPIEVTGTTVNRLCASGMEAIVQAARAIQVGQGNVMIAGGVESMSRAPLVMLKPEMGLPRGNHTLVDTTLGWRFVNPRLAARYSPISMGETTERVATHYHISRETQDYFAYESHQKASKAWQEQKFSSEVVPVSIKQKNSENLVEIDGHFRPDTTIDQLQQLPPVFVENGTVTAGNSAGMNDGASALILMEKSYAKRLGIRPLGEFIDSAVAGVHPDLMGTGPIPATHKILRRTGLSVAEIDVFEVNEAFAAQALACIQELQIPCDRVNPNGGSIALGHPLGASGARIVTTLLYELQRRNGTYGLATMCVGVGQGISMLVKSIEPC